MKIKKKKKNSRKENGFVVGVAGERESLNATRGYAVAAEGAGGKREQGDRREILGLWMLDR